MALMVFDCGPGYKKDAPRAQWNRTAIEMARAFERNGLAALSTGAEAQSHSIATPRDWLMRRVACSLRRIPA